MQQVTRTTTYEEALAIARERQSYQYLKTGRKPVFGIVSFTSTTGTRFRIYTYTHASKRGLQDCKVGETIYLEVCLD